MLLTHPNPNTKPSFDLLTSGSMRAMNYVFTNFGLDSSSHFYCTTLSYHNIVYAVVIYKAFAHMWIIVCHQPRWALHHLYHGACHKAVSLSPSFVTQNLINSLLDESKNDDHLWKNLTLHPYTGP